MSSNISIVVNNEPYGLDLTQKRIIVYGNVITSGSYTAGGYLPSWSNLQDQSGQNVLFGTLTQPNIAPVTAYSISSNVANITCTNTLLTGQSVILNGVTANLNSQQLLAQNILPGSFTVNVVTGNAGTINVSGQAITVIGPDYAEVESVMGSGLNFDYNKTTARIQCYFGSNELATGNLLTNSDQIAIKAEYLRG